MNGRTARMVVEWRQGFGASFFADAFYLQILPGPI
jgi:hypothetical protein